MEGFGRILHVIASEAIFNKRGDCSPALHRTDDLLDKSGASVVASLLAMTSSSILFDLLLNLRQRFLRFGQSSITQARENLDGAAGHG